MAKDRPPTIPPSVGAPQATGASPVPPQQPSETDALRSELERLRRENDLLRKGQGLPPGLDATRGEMKLWRVSLPDVKVRKTKRVVHVRETAPLAYHTCPPSTYEDLDLFLKDADADLGRIEAAAWKRYLAEGHTVRVRDNDEKEHTRPLDERDRVYFFIDADGGPYAEHLDIPAHSRADAYELFCKLHVGGLRTTHLPTVVEVPPTKDKEKSAA